MPSPFPNFRSILDQLVTPLNNDLFNESRLLYASEDEQINAVIAEMQKEDNYNYQTQQRMRAAGLDNIQGTQGVDSGTANEIFAGAQNGAFNQFVDAPPNVGPSAVGGMTDLFGGIGGNIMGGLENVQGFLGSGLTGIGEQTLDQGNIDTPLNLIDQFLGPTNTLTDNWNQLYDNYANISTVQRENRIQELLNQTADEVGLHGPAGVHRRVEEIRKISQRFDVDDPGDHESMMRLVNTTATNIGTNIRTSFGPTAYPQASQYDWASGSDPLSIPDNIDQLQAAGWVPPNFERMATPPIPPGMGAGDQQQDYPMGNVESSMDTLRRKQAELVEGMPDPAAVISNATGKLKEEIAAAGEESASLTDDEKDTIREARGTKHFQDPRWLRIRMSTEKDFRDKEWLAFMAEDPRFAYMSTNAKTIFSEIGKELQNQYIIEQLLGTFQGTYTDYTRLAFNPDSRDVGIWDAKTWKAQIEKMSKIVKDDLSGVDLMDDQIAYAVSEAFKRDPNLLKTFIITSATKGLNPIQQRYAKSAVASDLNQWEVNNMDALINQLGPVAIKPSDNTHRAISLWGEFLNRGLDWLTPTVSADALETPQTIEVPTPPVSLEEDMFNQQSTQDLLSSARAAYEMQPRYGRQLDAVFGTLPPDY